MSLHTTTKTVVLAVVNHATRFLGRPRAEEPVDSRRRRDEDWRDSVPPAQNNWPIAGSGLSLDLARDRMRFERVRSPPFCLLLTRGDTIEIAHACTRACMHTRATHTYTIHDDTTGYAWMEIAI